MRSRLWRSKRSATERGMTEIIRLYAVKSVVVRNDEVSTSPRGNGS